MLNLCQDTSIRSNTKCSRESKFSLQIGKRKEFSDSFCLREISIDLLSILYRRLKVPYLWRYYAAVRVLLISTILSTGETFYRCVALVVLDRPPRNR